MIASDPSICSRARAIFTARRSSGCQRVEREREIRSGFAGLAIAGAFALVILPILVRFRATPRHTMYRGTPPIAASALKKTNVAYTVTRVSVE